MDELTYTRVGDYLYPDISLSEKKGEHPPLDWYGMMHKEYLRKFQPIRYNILLLTEQLYPVCREVDAKAALWLTEIPTLATAHDVIMAALVCR
jgi:hypothetical protein